MTDNITEESNAKEVVYGMIGRYFVLIVYWKKDLGG